MGTELSTLSAEEAGLLVEMESAVEYGIKHALAAGAALTVIRERKLYRATHNAFDTYTLERFGITARRANQYIDGAKTMKEITDQSGSSTGTTVPKVSSEVENSEPAAKPVPLPTNERQMREIAKVEPARRQEVLQAAAAGGPLTAAKIKTAAAKTALCPRCTRFGTPSCPACRAAYAKALPPAEDMVARTEGRAVASAAPDVCPTCHRPY